MKLPIETTPYDLSDDFSKVKRSSYYEVVKFIMADCDSALKVSDDVLPWRIKLSSEGGRLNKALAEALKSRMILYAASPLYNDGKNYWDEAYTVNTAALSDLRSHGFELYRTVNYPQTYSVTDAYLYPNSSISTLSVSYAALYNEYFCTSTVYSTTDPIDKETIYQTNAGQGNLTITDGIGAQHGYKTGTCPSQELVDAFETTDGEPVLNLANPYLDEKHTQPNYNSNNKLYDPKNPYANRDPRFYADIYYNGSKRKAVWEFAETPGCIENYNPKDALASSASSYRTRIIATWDGEPKTGLSPSSRSMTRTGYYIRKFLHPNCGDANGGPQVGGANFKFARLGEVILNCAEAAVESNHLTEARDLIDEIRERVGMPDLPKGLGQAELRLRLRNERRIELAMEEDRYFDVRRWSDPSGDLSATDKWVGAMDITRNADGTYTYTRRPVRSTERKCYTNKYLKIPISLNEENRMKTLTGEDWQNPGW